MDKLNIARRELGMATSLFLQDKDPVCIHLLACAAAELLRGICKTKNISSFALMVISDKISIDGELVDQDKFVKIHNEAYNAIKHWYKNHTTQEVRDDTGLEIRDEDNEAILYQAWHDYSELTEGMPIEAQAFQMWFRLKHRVDVLCIDGTEEEQFHLLVLENADRSIIKKSLNHFIAHLKNIPAYVDDVLTEHKPLELNI